MRDFTTDSVPRPLYIAGLAGTLPEWALSAPIPQLEELSKLSSNAFADPAHRLLPLHTKQATLCSAVYLAACAGIYPEGTEDRIKAAAEALGVADEAAVILNAERPKAAAASLEVEKEAHALEIEDGAAYGLDPGPLNYLPCHDSFSIDRSGEELAKCASRQKLPPEMVHSAAVALTKAATLKNCLDVLPPQILALGTERVADWQKAATLIQDRVRVVGREGISDYDELIKLGAEHPEQADAVIDGLRDLDAHHNISYWDKAGAVCSPWEVVYCGPTMQDIEKMASSHFVLGGALVPIPVFSSLPRDRVSAGFSKAAAETIFKAQESSDSAEITRALGGLEDDLQGRLFNVLVAQ